MRKKVGVCAAIVFWCLGLCLFSGVSYAAEKTFKLELSNFMPLTDQLSQVLDDWCKDVEKRTNGRVKVTHHPGSTLTSMPQTYDSVKKGIADVGFGVIGFNPGRFPLSEVLELPYGSKSSQLSTRMANEFYKKFKPKEWEDTKLLFLFVTTPGYIHTRKPVNKLEEMKGLKIRAPGGPISEMVKAFEAIPVVVPTPEIYDALNKGIVDGITGVFPAMVTFKWGEVCKYTTFNYLSAGPACEYLVMNKNIFNSMPPDLQRIIDQLSGEYAEKISKTTDEQDLKAMNNLIAQKHTMITLSKAEDERWARAAAPLRDSYIKEKSAKGLPAAEAISFCEDWMKRNLK